MAVEKMSDDEICQFLTCARVGRVGLSTRNGPYVVPVGYGYADGKVFFHTCKTGQKMDCIRQKESVCFEVDEALSDGSMYKSVIVQGTAQIIKDKDRMLPYLQKLIDKYRVPLEFNQYMRKIGADTEKELEVVRICVITPTSVTGRKRLSVAKQKEL